MIVGAGGFVGAALRYSLSGAVHRVLSTSVFPWGTLAVNGLGCLVIGVLGGWAEQRQFAPDLRLFLLVGLLGGFTTFSTFGYETFALLRDSQHLQALGNVALHMAVGLLAVWAGFVLARSF